jgi:dihydrolipoamide dehydrogenase
METYATFNLTGVNLKHYRVAIIGGGPGGYEAAIRLNQYGIDCVVVEKSRLGGICLNWGCIPTKALVKSSELWHEIAEAESYGLAAKQGTLDYAKLFARKNEVVEKLVSGVEFLFRKRQIPVLLSKALSINKTDEGFSIKLDNDEDISSDYVIIATGSVPKELPNLKIDEKDILSSTGVLQMEQLPKSLAVIGGGVVGCEFASVYNALGVEVHLIEFLPAILSTEDDEVAKRLQICLKKAGIRIKTGIGVNSYYKADNNIILKLSDDSELAVEKALLCVGRTPLLGVKCLSAEPIKMNGAIQIDKFMQTSIPNVYAIGDVTGKLPLAHTASKQGLIVAEHILSIEQKTPMHFDELKYENIPRCTFTNPEVSSCGLTEQQALDKYKEIKIGRFPFSANGKALAGGNTNGFVKIIATADDFQLVGMHIIGPNAAELIAQGSILINLKATATDVEKVVFAHPTLSEAIMEAIEDLRGLSIHKL